MDTPGAIPEPGTGGLLARLVPRYADNRRLLVYVSVVVGIGLFVLARFGAPPAALLSATFAAWLLINILAELLWLETLTGDCSDSMASTANFGVIFLLSGGLAIWTIAASVLIATRFIQKRDWLKSLFGLGQMTITAAVSVGLFHLLRPNALTAVTVREPAGFLAMVAVAAAYFFVNTGLVAGAVALERRARFWPVWRENFAYRNSIVSALALFAFSPLLVLSYLSLGYAGVALFFVPLLIVRNQNREYMNLQRMTQALIATERMAAKGEMAAEVAHEINNYLAVLSGRTQLLLMRAGKSGEEGMKADAEIIRQQIQRMSSLAKGLLDFSHKEVNIRDFDLNKLVTDTAEFVRPQNLFDRVEIVTELDAEVGEVQADPGQLQQVLLNLVKNAAEAMRDARPDAPADAGAAVVKDGRIAVRTARVRKGIRVTVVDDGPGMSRDTAARVFEPGFTRKPDGHGYGLATCYRILENHHGRIWVESEEGKGAAFHLELPRAQTSTVDRDADTATGSRRQNAA